LPKEEQAAAFKAKAAAKRTSKVAKRTSKVAKRKSRRDEDAMVVAEAFVATIMRQLTDLSTDKLDKLVKTIGPFYERLRTTLAYRVNPAKIPSRANGGAGLPGPTSGDGDAEESCE
jgi:hypothetical protein